jgi:hypothetical protein
MILGIDINVILGIASYNEKDSKVSPKAKDVRRYFEV